MTNEEKQIIEKIENLIKNDEDYYIDVGIATDNEETANKMLYLDNCVLLLHTPKTWEDLAIFDCVLDRTHKDVIHFIPKTCSEDFLDYCLNKIVSAYGMTGMNAFISNIEINTNYFK